MLTRPEVGMYNPQRELWMWAPCKHQGVVHIVIWLPGAAQIVASLSETTGVLRLAASTLARALHAEMPLVCGEHGWLMSVKHAVRQKIYAHCVMVQPHAVPWMQDMALHEPVQDAEIEIDCRTMWSMPDIPDALVSPLWGDAPPETPEQFCEYIGTPPWIEVLPPHLHEQRMKQWLRTSAHYEVARLKLMNRPIPQWLLALERGERVEKV